ncbi:dicarboxylate/amino acid:cation symporter [bacterium]|nr:dicarboxylate/amino acid:cation symporter [bacterium]MDA7926169.1 dicarboxylate/amino acid:cation symporter [Mariniblastus sp.]MDB4357499.1 dicarboxylate/amino acid:cation symporter [Mariniblastus sp.]MDB4368764.1 dicarboxylate/amino acid:cation symporter [bacterium]MDB4380642.1 dicarboxylate/amino acid:cation symporter [Mariniblastus sp.]
MFKSWQALTLWKRVLVGLVLGLGLGLAVRYGTPDSVKANETLSGFERAAAIGDNWFKPFGDAFVRLIKMLIIPLIVTTLVSGVTAMGDPKKLGSLGARTIGLYMLTTLFAVSLGLAMGTLIKPGVGVQYNTASAADVASVTGKMEAAEQAGGFVDRLLDIIPSNPVAALSDGQVLPTIFFSLMIGIGILFVGKAADPVRHFFDAAAEVVMRITMMVMELAPYGVCALMAWVMATKGIEVLSNLLWLAIALYAACIFQIIFVYGFMIIRLFLGLPLKQFFRGIADAQGVAFSTASSSATLPVTISCAETNLGVDKSVAGSVLPLGATINMDGTAIYLGLVALFAAQADGLQLDMSQYVMVAMTATLVSIGAAGIPSAGLLLAATVLSVVGISPEQSLLIIAFIFPFDRLLDMMRTLTNVSGDIAVACTVAKWEGELDEDVFRNDAEV